VKTRHLLFFLIAIFLVIGRVAGATVVQADSFERILEMSLQKYKNNMEKLVQNSMVRLPKDTIILRTSNLVGDCTSLVQGISMQVATKGNTVRQIFKFTDCRGTEGNLSLERTGPGLQPLSLIQFLEGDWGFNESLDFWKVDLNWQNVRISSQKKDGIRKSFISLDGLNVPGVFLSYVDLQMTESHEKKSGVETDSIQYSIRESPSAMFENYTISTQKTDKQIFSIEKYELDHGVLTPKSFADFYQPRIIEGVVNTLSETLGSIPLHFN